jgi:hypothetical protein
VYLERSFKITAEIRELLLKVSPSTIDRLLKGEKKKLTLKGKNDTKPGKLLKKHIPIRTYFADVDKKPGFFSLTQFTTAAHLNLESSALL